MTCHLNSLFTGQSRLWYGKWSKVLNIIFSLLTSLLPRQLQETSLSTSKVFLKMQYFIVTSHSHISLLLRSNSCWEGGHVKYLCEWWALGFIAVYNLAPGKLLVQILSLGCCNTFYQAPMFSNPCTVWVYCICYESEGVTYPPIGWLEWRH